MKIIATLTAILACGLVQADAVDAHEIKSRQIESDFELTSDVAGFPWNQADEALVLRSDQAGDADADPWRTEIRSLWTTDHLYVLFTAHYATLSVDPSIAADRHGDFPGIGEHEVVGLLIADGAGSGPVHEFIASPLGQTADARHVKLPARTATADTAYASGWTVRVNHQATLKRWTCQFRIPWSAIGDTPVVAGRTLEARAYRGTGDKKAVAAGDALGSLVLVGGQAVPEPTLVVDFEGPSPKATWSGGTVQELGGALTVANSGIAGSDCVDFWRFADRAAPKPLVLEGEEIKQHLAGIWSMTVTGWIRREADYEYLPPPGSTEYVLNCPGRFQVSFDKWGRLRLLFGESEADRHYVWSSWMSIGSFNPGDRWTFFAFTYDGTRGEKETGTITIGNEKYTVEADQALDAGTGRLAASGLQKLFIGARSADGTGVLRGMLDRVRIYASADRNDNRALSAEQIEAIRRQDLGRDWLDSQALIAQQQNTASELEHKALRTAHWSEPLNMHQVGVLQRVISTVPPKPVDASRPSGTMIGDHVCFQLAASSQPPGTYRIEVSPFVTDDGVKLAADVKTYHVQHVPVEANNNGGIRTSITSRPPKRWREYQVAEAPFKAAEVLTETDQIVLKKYRFQPDLYQALLVDAKVSDAAAPGIYAATVRLTGADGATVSCPIKVRVYDVTKPEYYALQNNHWFWVEPENLAYNRPLAWWSEEHWRMIDGSMQNLRDLGQDCVNIPLINYREHAAIRTIRQGDGYTFDFARFDRFFQMAIDRGFRTVAGVHSLLLPRAGGAVDHFRYSGICVWEDGQAEPAVLFPPDTEQDDWLAFLPTFYDALYAHLKEKGWTDTYIQHQYDEPSDLVLYKRIAGITRKHMPGIDTVDATKTKPEYSPHVDIMVFGLDILRADAQKVVAERRARGKSSWFYHCASPYPPNPNRHLDDPLTSSALYPYYAYRAKAEGYLWWAANVYRGADPYASSIGPLPGGKVDPGHGPGDNWMYYPGPKGLRPSMRMIAFRHGLSAHTLLTKLEKHDATAADRLARRVGNDPVNYSTDPEEYYEVFEALLSAVESVERE